MKRMRFPMLMVALVVPFLMSRVAWAGFYDKYYKKPPYQGWKYIVLHHSATRGGSAQAFHKYHTEQGWGGLCYHFVIGNGNGMADGEVATGFRWKQQIAGTHCTVNAWDYNIYGIGICLVGNFEENRPTAKQIKSLVKLIRRLQKQYHISLEHIVRHRDVPYDNNPSKTEATVCPGRYFPFDKIKHQLKPRSRTVLREE